MLEEPNFFDKAELKSRGWTDSMIRKLLIEHDDWGPVDHWANFQGKAYYYALRVESV